MERLGEIFGYEISKHLVYEQCQVETPLGIADSSFLGDELVLVAILRAGLPIHRGLLHIFDRADNGFVSAMRKHHKDGTFEIAMQYINCPDLDGKVLVLADAMIATGSSVYRTIEALHSYGRPKDIHVVSAISSSEGIEYIQRLLPSVKLWIGTEDEELTAKYLIVPGLGDAGDLSFGEKRQE